MSTEPQTATQLELRSILASTDFSETAAHGVAAAAQLARHAGAVLHVVHAVDLTYTASTTVGLTTDFLEGLHSTARNELEAFVKPFRTEGLEIDLRICDGGAADALLAEADAVNADLLVLATHGRRGIAHTLLGSTAEHVLQRTPRPVLSLHDGDPGLTLPPRRVLIPTDLSGADSALALEGARRLLGATPEETKIHLLHAIETPGKYGRNVAAESWVRMIDRLVTVAEEQLASAADRMRDEGFTVEASARIGSGAAVILEAAAELDVDAIAMRTAEHNLLGRLFLGSTARRIVQKASCPVLTIRWSAAAESA